jgi:T5SS/PEP-CTERM-associated repeat protein
MRSASFSMKKTVFLAVLMSSTALGGWVPITAYAQELVIDGGATQTITGTAETFDEVVVGDTGAGTLTIEDGGSLSSGATTINVIGSDAGSTGVVTVTDGSTWSNAASLIVGNRGNGSLTIADGGSVSNFNGSVGAEVGGIGTVTVTGEGSTWSNGVDLSVGDSGTGTLTIEGGGSVSSIHGFIGVGSTGEGTVTVTEEDSTWTNTGRPYCRL